MVQVVTSKTYRGLQRCHCGRKLLKSKTIKVVHDFLSFEPISEGINIKEYIYCQRFIYWEISLKLYFGSEKWRKYQIV